MLITSARKKWKPQPIKPAMSLHSKNAEVAAKAVGDVGEADKVDPMPTWGELYLKEKLTRWQLLRLGGSPQKIMPSSPPPAKKQKHYQLMQLKKTGKTHGMINKSSATVAE